MVRKEKIKLIVLVILLVVILVEHFRWPDIIASTATKWGASLITGVVMSAVSESFVEKLTRNKLKKINIKLSILGKKFSVTLFVIAALIFRFLLFR